MRYFSKPRARVRSDDDEWEYCPPLMDSVTVSDHEAVDTGLIDVTGNSIMRVPNPMGFGRDEEW